VIVRSAPSSRGSRVHCTRERNDLIRVLCHSLLRPSAPLPSNAEIQTGIAPRLYRHAVPRAHGFRGSL
jgi:hypothetical protein